METTPSPKVTEAKRTQKEELASIDHEEHEIALKIRVSQELPKRVSLGSAKIWYRVKLPPAKPVA